jgi:hypothetical protein
MVNTGGIPVASLLNGILFIFFSQTAWGQAGKIPVAPPVSSNANPQIKAQPQNNPNAKPGVVLTTGTKGPLTPKTFWASPIRWLK